MSPQTREARARAGGRPVLARLALLAAAAILAPPAHAQTQETTMQITSTAFDAGSAIPSRFTCDGKNVSPALSWSDLPEGTRSLALIVDDPDAPKGTWVHWVLYGLSAERDGLPEGVPGRPEVLDGALQGLNDFGDPGYGGPCPPPGGAHRYFFRLYALDARPDLSAGATKAQLERAIEGHVLGRAELMGRYARQR